MQRHALKFYKMVVTFCTIVALLFAAYLLGSVPSAVWIGKHYYGIDVRDYGSKNAGATNMLRVLGLRAALPVFVIDFLKGFIAVSAMSLMKLDLALSPAWIINLKIIAVVVAVLGHIFPIFASFRGGKGVSTLIGAITGILPTIALMCFAVWILVFIFTHYVSLSSITAGCCFPFFVSIFSAVTYHNTADFSATFIIFSIAVASLLVWTHRKNIVRLKNGTEPKTYIWKKR